MKINVEKILLIYLVSLTFFRVDLSLGLFSFFATPQLILSIIVILFFFIKGLNTKNISKNAIAFLLLLAALLFYFLITILLNYHGSLQFKRYFLFSEIVLSSISFLFLFNGLKFDRKLYLIKKWIKYSINIHLIWISIQFILFFKGYHFYAESWEVWYFINPLPHGIGYFFPRLEGGFLDPNVSGYFFSFLFFLSIYVGANSRKNLFLMAFFILLTLSRSAIAAFAICVVILQFNKIKISFTKLLKGALILTSFIICCLLIITYLGYWDQIVTAMKIRFVDAGSTNIHNSLIELGLEKTFSSFETFIFGNGFASSPYFAYSLLEEMGNKWKYANFHSEYVSIFFETGIVGFLMYYAILVFPFVIRKKISFSLLSILLLMLLQGIFYQQYNFHYYWVVLTMVFCLNQNYVRVKK